MIGDVTEEPVSANSIPANNIAANSIPVNNQTNHWYLIFQNCLMLIDDIYLMSDENILKNYNIHKY